MEIIRFETIDSTSTFARNNIENYNLPFAVVAGEQSKGRGRTGKSFYSPAGRGLYFTLASDLPAESALVTPAAAVAVCRAIEKMTDIVPQIKWVNDVYSGDKKVCGILCETLNLKSGQALLTGIGINLLGDYFPSDIPVAASLGIDVNKDELMNEIIKNLFDLFGEDKESIVSEYSGRMMLLGKNIVFYENSEPCFGSVRGIDFNCHLIVETDGVIKKLSSGIVEVA